MCDILVEQQLKKECEIITLKISVNKTPISYIRLRVKEKHVHTKKFLFCYPYSVQRCGWKENDICFMLGGECFRACRRILFTVFKCEVLLSYLCLRLDQSCWLR